MCDPRSKALTERDSLSTVFVHPPDIRQPRPHLGPISPASVPIPSPFAVTPWLPMVVRPLAVHPLAVRTLLRYALVPLALAGSALGLTAPAAPALDSVQLTYGVLQAQPIAMADIEAFALGASPSRDIQVILGLLQVDPAAARRLLTQEIALDPNALASASQTFAGTAFWDLVSTALRFHPTPVSGDGPLEVALLAAAADRQVTLLEVLQSIEANRLVVDAQQALAVADQLRQDVTSIQAFFAAFEP